MQHEARIKAIQDLQLANLNKRMQNFKTLAEKINTLSLSLITELASIRARLRWRYAVELLTGGLRMP
jgi:hypothetical protein